MFRNYFVPGFALALLGLFTFSRPPAAPQAATAAGGSKRANNQALQTSERSQGPPADGTFLDKDKTLWDRDEVGILARLEMNKKLEEFGLDDPCIRQSLGLVHGSCVPPRDYDPPPAEAMIAFVPDPIHTHLALYFDREVDAIQQALQDRPSANSSGWLYTGQWLPWDPVAYEASENPIDRTNVRTFDVGREIAPGVLIYRTNDFPSTTKPDSRFLLVFLIGESPTGGVTNQKQFSNAVDEWQRIERLDRNKKRGSTLRILGPNFSTSMMTLNSLLDAGFCKDPPAKRNLNQAGISCIQSAQVISGSISANPKVVRARFSGLSKAKFISLRENAGADQGMLLNYLQTSEHIQPEYVALLSEDQTLFGTFSGNPDASHVDAEKHGPLVLHFPREISQLRNAYAKNSILRIPSSNQNSNAATQSLDLNLEDRHDEEDDVPSFSNDQDAVSEESTLSVITREMYNRHVRAVVVSATDTLDTIFVAQFLRLNLPNARIVISDADLIFARPGQAHNFRGMLTVTTYPLIGNSVDWGGRFLEGASGGHSDPYGTLLPDRVFPSAADVGIYNAIRLLEMSPVDFTQACAPSEINPAYPGVCQSHSLWLFGYNDPFRGGNRPPLWLSGVGRGGFWPVALLTPEGNKSMILAPEIFANNGKDVSSPDGTIPSGIFDSESRARLAAAFIVAFSVSIGIFFCWFATLAHGPQYVFGLADTNSEKRAWVMLGILLCCSWIARLLILDLPWKAFRGDPVNWIMLGLEILLTGFAIWLIVKALNTGSRWVWAAVLLLTMAGLEFAFDAVPPKVFASRVFYLYRSEHLLNGVSPALPFIFLFAAVIAVVSSHVQSLFVFSKNLQPYLPIPPAAGRTDVLLPSRRDTGRVYRACHSPWRLVKTEINPAGWVPLISIAGGITLIFAISFSHWFDTLESHSYTVCLTLFAALITFMLTYEVFWSFTIWTYLSKKLLVPLERSPLRVCFSRVSGFSWRRIWFSIDVPWQIRYKALSRAHESMCHIAREAGYSDVQARAQTAETIRCEMFGCTKDAAQLLPSFRKYERSLCAFGTEVINSILFNSVGQEALATDLDSSLERRTKTLDQIAEADPLRASAEEFVGLIYIHGIQHVLVDLRRHVFAFAFGYSLLLLALNVYPVGPHHTIMMLLVILFVVFLVTIVLIFGQMSRDSVLSRTTDTEPGKLDFAFYVHVAAALGVPLLGLIASQFPEISNFLYSWLQPSLQAVK